mmetsp:Transcript_96582/g.185451  ORF Transcript_96582/g.185451 Transcript_96582/m.185451 type:complete len:200 (+) Transcript_96582:141-740(+)
MSNICQMVLLRDPELLCLVLDCLSPVLLVLASIQKQLGIRNYTIRIARSAQEVRPVSELHYCSAKLICFAVHPCFLKMFVSSIVIETSVVLRTLPRTRFANAQIAMVIRERTLRSEFFLLWPWLLVRLLLLLQLVRHLLLLLAGRLRPIQARAAVLQEFEASPFNVCSDSCCPRAFQLTLVFVRRCSCNLQYQEKQTRQ